MQIGEPDEVIIAVPDEDPIPQRQPVREPAPERAPAEVPDAA